jgi:hypothetical protein
MSDKWGQRQLWSRSELRKVDKSVNEAEFRVMEAMSGKP